MSFSNKVYVLDTGSPNLAHYEGESLDLYKSISGFETYSVDELKGFMEFHPHGSMCASQIVRAWPDAHITHIRVLDSNGSGALEWFKEGLLIAKRLGPGIVSSSLGVTLPYGINGDSIKDLRLSSLNFTDRIVVNVMDKNIPIVREIEQVMKEMVDLGFVFISASGNESSSEPSYPGSSRFSISIGSANVLINDKGDPYANLSLFSNRDCTFVLDGDNEKVWSHEQSKPVVASGTSFSAPRFSGVAGRILQKLNMTQGELVAYCIALARSKNQGFVPERVQASGYGSLDYLYRDFVSQS